MAIIGTLPNTISNGQTVDATPVMADFNFIVNQVNANATPLGSLTAPTGTRMSFNQAAVPVGWTQDVSFSDYAMRIVSGAGGGSGGAVAWSSWSGGGTFNLNAFTISQAQLPAHSHVININDPGHVHGSSSGTNFITLGGATVVNFGGASLAIQQAASTATNGTGITATANNTGSGASITPNFTTPAVHYTDWIIGVKS